MKKSFLTADQKKLWGRWVALYTLGALALALVDRGMNPLQNLFMEWTHNYLTGIAAYQLLFLCAVLLMGWLQGQAVRNVLPGAKWWWIATSLGLIAAEGTYPPVMIPGMLACAQIPAFLQWLLMRRECRRCWPWLLWSLGGAIVSIVVAVLPAGLYSLSNPQSPLISSPVAAILLELVTGLVYSLISGIGLSKILADPENRKPEEDARNDRFLFQLGLVTTLTGILVVFYNILIFQVVGQISGADLVDWIADQYGVDFSIFTVLRHVVFLLPLGIFLRHRLQNAGWAIAVILLALIACDLILPAIAANLSILSDSTFDARLDMFDNLYVGAGLILKSMLVRCACFALLSGVPLAFLLRKQAGNRLKWWVAGYLLAVLAYAPASVLLSTPVGNVLIVVLLGWIGLRFLKDQPISES